MARRYSDQTKRRAKNRLPTRFNSSSKCSNRPRRTWLKAARKMMLEELRTSKRVSGGRLPWLFDKSLIC